jgi:hypothetical protein
MKRPFKLPGWLGPQQAALLLAALLGLGVGAGVQGSGLTHRWEDWLALAVLEGARPPTRDPGLVRIVADDMADQPWPWPKLDYAILLHAIAPYEPDLLALDWPLDLPDVGNEVYERQLARQMKAFRGIVVSARAWEVSRETVPPQDSITVEGQVERLPALEGASWPRLEGAEARRAPLVLGSSGRAPLLLRLGDTVVPSFPLAVYGKWLGAYWPHCKARLGRDIVLRDYENKFLARIPIDADGALRPVPASRLPAVPRVEFYTAILSAEQMHNQKAPLFDLNRLRHSLVLATIEHPDAVSLGADGLFAGERVARILLQLMTRAHWEPVPAPTYWAILAGAAVLMAWGGLLRSAWHALMALAGGLAFLAVDTWFFLRFFDLQLPWVGAAVAGICAWGVAFAASAPRTADREPAPAATSAGSS